MSQTESGVWTPVTSWNKIPSCALQAMKSAAEFASRKTCDTWDSGNSPRSFLQSKIIGVRNRFSSLWPPGRSTTGLASNSMSMVGMLRLRASCRPSLKAQHSVNILSATPRNRGSPPIHPPEAFLRRTPAPASPVVVEMEFHPSRPRRDPPNPNGFDIAHLLTGSLLPISFPVHILSCPTEEWSYLNHLSFLDPSSNSIYA